MNTYTTCRSCGGLLHTTDGDTVHPGCPPKLTKVERLAEQWLAAIESGDTAREDELQTQIMELDARPPRLLDAALTYAGWGWPVFPLHPAGTIIHGKRADKHPATRNGFKDATTEPEQIRKWWERKPHNIGIATGHAFDVIDIDPPDGPATYTRLLDDEVIPDVHGEVATSSGGLHLYIRPTGDGNRTRFLPGLDYRGVGGYVVAPPSTLGEPGRSWAWITKPSPVITGMSVDVRR